ncbi:polysaccharide deacetylase family protein [Candidatus Bathyarchaeota archaeon]|nr:polysaccharide deacetylase family protein [Candidatus Bathyarchaeota archaeon]
MNNVLVLISFDDGVREDLRSAMLLEKYGLKGNFFIITSNIGRELSITDVLYLAELHEIGSHTVNHVRLLSASLKRARTEILESKRTLENIIGRRVTSFAYPFGAYDRATIEMVKEAGFCCARTTDPYNLTLDANPYKLKVTLWASPNPLKLYPQLLKNCLRYMAISIFILKPWITKRWNELAKDLYKSICRTSKGVFHILVHSREIKKRSEWRMLEEVFNILSSYAGSENPTVSEYVKLYLHRVNAKQDG